MMFFSHHFGEVKGSLVMGSLAKIGSSSNIFIVVSSGDFDGLLVCWFIGEGCFLLACMVCLPLKFIPMLFFGLLGTLRNALDSSWAAKGKLSLKNLCKSVGDSWDQYGSTTFVIAGFQA